MLILRKLSFLSERTLLLVARVVVDPKVADVLVSARERYPFALSPIAWLPRVRLLLRLGRSGPNLEPGTMHIHVTNGPRNGLNIGRKVGPCPGIRRRWVLGSVHAFSQAVHAANTYRPRFQVRARPSES